MTNSTEAGSNLSWVPSIVLNTGITYTYFFCYGVHGATRRYFAHASCASPMGIMPIYYDIYTKRNTHNYNVKFVFNDWIHLWRTPCMTVTNLLVPIIIYCIEYGYIIYYVIYTKNNTRPYQYVTVTIIIFNLFSFVMSLSVSLYHTLK